MAGFLEGDVVTHDVKLYAKRYGINSTPNFLRTGERCDEEFGDEKCHGGTGYF
jgi:hypothetical protein